MELKSSVERKCSYQGCANILSPQVPKEIDLCSEHQFDFKRFKQRRIGETLPEGMAEFIYHHPQGVILSQAAKSLEVNRKKIAELIAKGKIEAKNLNKSKKKPLWLLPQDTMIELAIVQHNWVTVSHVADLISKCWEVTTRYAKKGLFGKTRKDFYGHLMISVSWLDNLGRVKKLLEEKVVEQIKSRKYRLVIKPGEINKQNLAKRLGISKTTLTQWEKLGLKVYRRKARSDEPGPHCFIKFSELAAFTKKAALGNEIKLKKESIEILTIFLERVGIDWKQSA
jgi:hypothetical protein